MAEAIIPQDVSDNSQQAQRYWEVYRRAQDARRASGFDQSARDAVDFRHGNQLTETEHNELQAINQPDVVFDRIYGAIDRTIAFLTSRTPRFTALPREDSDQKLASTWRIILEYIWDISGGNGHFKDVIDDRFNGVGYMVGYIDRMADAGRGEVMIKRVPWYKVYWDAAARLRYNEDADYCIVSDFFTRANLIATYPYLGEFDPITEKFVIDSIAQNDVDEDYPSSNFRNTNDIQTPDVIKDIDFSQERFKVLTVFEPIKVPFYWVVEQRGKETDERLVSKEQFAQLVENENFLLAYQAKKIQVKEVMQTRWQETAVLGDYILYSVTLNTDICPIIPFPDIRTDTPYPKSSVNLVKDAQRLLNKVYSLLVTHLQTSATNKILLPEGSVDDIEQFMIDWQNPYAAQEYNAEYGEPHIVGTSPASSEAYGLIPQIERYIDLNIGQNDLSQGLKSGATGAVRTDMMLREQGESRGKSKLQDIEFALSRLGQVVHNLAKGHYTVKKTFRIVQPNNSLSEATINVYTDRKNEAATIANDVTLGFFDIRVDAGSTLPSNRDSELAQALEEYKMGLASKVDYWKKANVDDLEGRIERDSELAQARSMIQSLEEELKKASGDLQTSDRELKVADRKIEREKTKADLTRITANAKAGQDIEKVKLSERVASILDKANFEINQMIASEKRGKEVPAPKKK